MSVIKSAIEIALEKTKGVEGDKEALLTEQYKKQGQRIASQFLNEPDFSLKEEIKKVLKIFFGFL